MSAAVSYPTVPGPVTGRWGATEIDVLRRHYVEGVAACAAHLPGRTPSMIWQAARRHRIPGPLARRRWTEEEDEILRSLWWEVSVEDLAVRLKRPHSGVYAHALAIGLSSGPPEGAEPISRAAKRCGFSDATMRRILRASDVPLKVVPTQVPTAKTKLRKRFVDRFAADAAVTAWLQSEYVGQAARARGLYRVTLHRWLRNAGVGGRPKRAWKHWRVPTETIDRVVAEHQGASC
jgi:hypothetical protein